MIKVHSAFKQTFDDNPNYWVEILFLTKSKHLYCLNMHVSDWPFYGKTYYDVNGWCVETGNPEEYSFVCRMRGENYTKTKLSQNDAESLWDEIREKSKRFLTEEDNSYIDGDFGLSEYSRAKDPNSLDMQQFRELFNEGDNCGRLPSIY